MTTYELAFLAADPFLPALIGVIRRQLRLYCKFFETRPLLLDVGGRKSPYTIGVPARVTISDIPRKGEIREKLGLGFTPTILRELQAQRSNIEACVVDDMTDSRLPSGHFDIVCCVEVIEHIEEDKVFVDQIARVLKPGGFLIVTTPNGDYVRNEPPNYNPDHVRHYSRDSLFDLLASGFGSQDLQVEWAIKTGSFRAKGLRSLELRRPVRAIETMACNVVSRWESRGLDQTPRRRAHLIARVRKGNEA